MFTPVSAVIKKIKKGYASIEACRNHLKSKAQQ